ncbi:MAG TPA: 3-phosphoshikimate 1-carboxyvinyltransferase, partial [Candidatus Acidoferrales bacterium]|nr:3-phosphoshikimate 1-carboxyvinyltransferase [Candidatus Acidoferrales bacterium]
MGKQKIQPARKITGGVEPPGDKSISHRYAMLAALAGGTSEIRHFSSAADCASTLECLRALGAGVEREGDTVRVMGCGGTGGRRARGLQRPRRALDAGNSGTTMRLLAGILAGQGFDSTLTGDASLRRRPMRRVIEPLARMGAQIRAEREEFAPLEIQGRRLQAIEYELPVASAQVKSAVLLAGLFAEGVTRVTEPVRTRDHSELALAEFGARLEREGRTISIHGLGGNGAGKLEARTVVVPGDLSSAVFFLVAACMLPDSNLLVRNAGLNPTRTAVLDVLATMGAPLSFVSIHGSSGELVGDIAVRYAVLEGGVIEWPAVAELIDELPMLAALGPFTEKGIEIRDAAELRVKESDRIAAVAENLRRMGARVEERRDGLLVVGRTAGKLRGAEIDSRGDHRIAMAFAIAALGAE